MSLLTVLNTLLAATLLPLAAFLVLLVWGRRLGREGQWAGTLATTFAVASFGLSLAALILWVNPADFNQSNYVEAFTHRWVQLPPAPPPPSAIGLPKPAPAAPDALTVGCVIDSLTIALFMILTLLNVLVHIFALGSLGNPANRSRIFALLALLNFSLLGFVLSNSLLQMFMFGELLGLAIFFLVRLGVEKPAASLRMYLMHLVGSGAFLLGLGILFLHTGSLARLAFFDSHGVSILSQSIRDTLGVQSSEFLFYPGGEGFLQMHWLTWAGICFLVAAFTRMAQFPFFTWLHAVAEGPVAITALVTMASLTAGAVLLTRLYPILTLDARLIAALVGCVTLAAGGAIALVQTDIRKILIWSTVSQGGYMLLFLGSGGFVAGILQLFTHGIVKTALLLAAGSVIQGLGTADIRQMGGLWKRFPITAIASLLAVLTLGGVPWLSGSYSTNLGLCCVWDYAHALQATSGRHFELLLFHIPAIFTYITALGIGRWWWLIFAGTNRQTKLYEAAHESAFLTFSIIILAAFYVGGLYEFGGILPLLGKGVPAILLGRVAATGGAGTRTLIVNGTVTARDIVMVDTGWAFVGLIIAGLLYFRGMDMMARFRRLPGVNVIDYWLRERMFFDELYEGVILPALFGLVAVAGLLERSGRALVKIVSNAISLGVAIVAHVEKKNREVPPEESHTSPEPGRPQE